MKIVLSRALTSLSGGKGSVRMSPEQIKRLIISRKLRVAALGKVKKPTEKTKARIAKNKEKISTLTVKLKVAIKKAQKKSDKELPGPVKAMVKRDSDKTARKVKRPAADLDAKQAKRMEVVTKARQAYTKAKLSKNAKPGKIEKLKEAYTDAFRSYMKSGKSKSESASFQIDPVTISARPMPGRMDPVVLAYNHIMSLSGNHSVFSGNSHFMHKHAEGIFKALRLEITKVTIAEDEDVAEYEVTGSTAQVQKARSVFESRDVQGTQFGGVFSATQL